MKWLIALPISALMFFVGYHHAARYVEDDSVPPAEEPDPAAEIIEGATEAGVPTAARS